MTAKQRKETIEEANKRGIRSRLTLGGQPFTTPPMDDDPFEKISQGFKDLSSVLAQGYSQNQNTTNVPGSPPPPLRVSQTGDDAKKNAGRLLQATQTSVRNAKRALRTNPTPAKKLLLKSAQDANRTAKREFDKVKDNVTGGKNMRSGRQIFPRTPTN